MTVPRVFVSTGSFGVTPEAALVELTTSGVVDVEFSGGVYQHDISSKLLKEPRAGQFQVHNYFPPPVDPFVFNLCDPDSTIRERSVLFACAAVDLSARLGSDVYSFHAGFLGTPSLRDLGQDWQSLERLSLDHGMELFAQSVRRINSRAEDKGVRLLVENNVLTKRTAEVNGENILLMTSPDNIKSTLSGLPSEVGLLMDVGHLAVSAQTLGFDAVSALEDLASLIGGYHLSENNGRTDSNHPLEEGSWFWDYLDPTVDFMTLEVDPKKVDNYQNQIALTKRKMMNSVEGN